jgi:NADPH:quinone reductase-like Zn-dependent oxidoreductase
MLMLALALLTRDASPAVVDVGDRDPDAGEVRVRVEAASINGFDLAVYVWDLMPHTFPVVLGRDFAGTVETVGVGVTTVRVGDRVAGVVQGSALGPGAIGERVTVDAATLAAVPGSVTSAQAAAVGLAGVAASDVVAALDLTGDDVVLVSGATGGVGVFVVQLVAARGARVVATARPGPGSELVRALGAADVIEYTGDLGAAVRAVAPDGVSKVVHAAGDPAALAVALAPGGQLASVLGATAAQVGRDDVTVTAVLAAYSPLKLSALLAEVAGGRLSVPVAASYSLAAAAAAFGNFGDGKLGKIVVTVP